MEFIRNTLDFIIIDRCTLCNLYRHKMCVYADSSCYIMISLTTDSKYRLALDRLIEIGTIFSLHQAIFSDVYTPRGIHTHQAP